ncbi:MAG: Ig-like domain-containing protein, partial [Blastocatellia bacterium]
PMDSGYTIIVANTGNTLTYNVVTGLTPSTDYLFKVSAINAAGVGPSSNQKFGTTLAFPAVTLSSTAPDPTNTSPIPVTATFSESVTGFQESEIVVTNGATSNFVAVSGAIYTFDVTPASQGLVSVDIPANIAFDIVNGGNTAAATLSRTYDSASPSVVLSTTAADPTNVSPFTVTATFSEAVSGFALGDIIVTNGVASSLAGGPSIYTFSVTPSSNGLVSVDVGAGVATDSVGNGNTAAATLSKTYDGTTPTLVLSTTVTDPTNVSPFTVTATFSEDVSGFALVDIAVTNGVASALSGGPSVYTFDVTPSGQGLVSINVAADMATDAAGNGNTVAATLSRTFDNISPT